MRPSRAIQGKLLRPFSWDLLGEEAFQPFLILLSLLDGRIGTRPLAAEDGSEAQLRKRADRWTEEKGVQEFELGVPGSGKPVVIDGLTKLD